MVAASQPLAAQAGLRVLQDGGNAVDAAVAAAAVLRRRRADEVGVGGDVFAIVYLAERGECSGSTPAGARPPRYRRVLHEPRDARRGRDR